MLNVVDFGADSNGGIDSSNAFVAAVSAAALNRANMNQLGDRIVVPPGKYLLQSHLHLFGNVQLEGFGTGTGNGGSRLQFGTGAGVVIHSPTSSPISVTNFTGGAKISGFDIYGSAPAFKEWRPNTEFAVGDCIQNLDDDVAYYECVEAYGVANRRGMSGAARPRPACRPELSKPWAAGEIIVAGTVRRSTANHDRNWYFRSINAGTTQLAEPNWNLAERGITSEPQSGIDWEARKVTGQGSLNSFNFFFADGELLWQSRMHSGILMLASGIVENCSILGFANAGISISAYVDGYPKLNANSWYISRCFISGCGGGIYVQGDNANAGTCINANALSTGTRPRRVDNNGRLLNGAHAFHDSSELGNTWIGCLAEAATGRGYLADGNTGYQRCVFINCYAEDCFRGSLTRGSIVLGGNQLLDSLPAFEEFGEGLFLDPIYGVSNFKIRSRPDLPDVPLGALDVPGKDLHGFYTFTDNKQGNNYFGWSRGQSRFFPNGWTFGTMPNLPHGFFGVAGYDAPEGPHWRDFFGHWRGVDTASGQYYLAVSTLFDNDPRGIARGNRDVGFRQEPCGGYVVNGTRYIGRIVVTAGYEGRPWEPNAIGSDYVAEPLVASMVTPPGHQANGFVYKCVRRGNSGSSIANWPTVPGEEFDDTAIDNPARWRCMGREPVYKYYGACV